MEPFKPQELLRIEVNPSMVPATATHAVVEKLDDGTYLTLYTDKTMTTAVMSVNIAQALNQTVREVNKPTTVPDGRKLVSIKILENCQLAIGAVISCCNAVDYASAGQRAAEIEVALTEMLRENH